jgi:Tfp pilus assembly protein PilF
VFDAFAADKDRDRAAKARYGIGLVLSARGDAAGARKELEASVALDPSDARAHYRLGQLALEAGDHATAIRSFTTAIGHDELHFGAAYGLARAHAAAGNAAESTRWTDRHRRILEALDAVAALVRRLPDAADAAGARVAIGARLEDAGARTRAAAWYERALKIDPRNPEARRRLASVRAAESRP